MALKRFRAFFHTLSRFYYYAECKITGIASYVPDYVLTNDELSHMVDTNDEWITTRVGIKERRILKGEETGSSDLGVKAVAELLKKQE